MKNIIVAGAGHGGLIAAAKLAEKGYNVTVYEKNAREELGHDWEDRFTFSLLEELIGVSEYDFPDNCWRYRGDCAFVSPAKRKKVIINYTEENRQKIEKSKISLLKEIIALNDTFERAIKDAVINAKLNKANNVQFICDDAGHFMNKIAKERIIIDAVIMDPPRNGADDKFLNSLLRLKPNKILYISCGPESLRNNIKYLTKNNYKIDVIQPVDMFPFTDHVETIVKLSLNYGGNHD